MSVTLQFEIQFNCLHADLARLGDWVVTSEHTLVVLERTFHYLFPNSVVPYLDFLREQKVCCNPYTFYVASKLEIQGATEERSSFFDEIMHAAVKRIGIDYKRHVHKERRKQCHSLSKSDVQSIMKTFVKQRFDLSANISRYGNAIHAEAGMMVTERVIELASPELAKLLGVRYQQFSLDRFGTDRYTQQLYDEGYPTTKIDELFIANWKDYLASGLKIGVDEQSSLQIIGEFFQCSP